MYFHRKGVFRSNRYTVDAHPQKSQNFLEIPRCFLSEKFREIPEKFPENSDRKLPGKISGKFREIFLSGNPGKFPGKFRGKLPRKKRGPFTVSRL